jgi:pimeloyl-ACP methyl ester carboxylesterase
VPTRYSLDIDGLAISHQQLDRLLSVDIPAWKAEAKAIASANDELGDKLPPELRTEQEALMRRLNEADGTVAKSGNGSQPAMAIDPGPRPAELTRLEATCRRITIRQGDHETVWRAWGSGPPLILLHGGFGSWTHWLRNIDALSAGNTVYAVDMPAFGDSDRPAGVMTSRSLAELLWASLDTILGPGAPTRIVGFSFGGVIAIQMASFRPERIERLVVVGSGGYGIARPQNVVLSKWRHLTTREELFAVHRQNLEALMIHDPKNVDDLALYLQAENTSRARIDSRAVAQATNVPEVLLDLHVPMDGIWGACDAVSKERLPVLKELLKRVDPASQFVVVENAGHWVQYEAAETVNRTLLRILAMPRQRPGDKPALEAADRVSGSTA